MTGTIIPSPPHAKESGRPGFRGWIRGRLPLLGAALSAIALYFAQPGTGGTGWLAWAALIPLFAAIDGRRYPQAFLLGFAWGVVYDLPMLTWISPFGSAPWIALALILAVIPGLFAVLAARIVRRGDWTAVWSVAALWTLFEGLRTFITFGLSWGDLSLTQTALPAALQTASWWGGVGLSFLVALANVALYALLKERFERSVPAAPAGLAARIRRSPARAAVAFAATSLLLGAIGGTVVHWRNDRALMERTIYLGLAQANFGRQIYTGVYDDPAAALRTYEALTDALARQGCRWVLWPEGAIPEAFPDRFERIAEVARRNRIYLIAGGGEFRGGRSYNVLYCYGPDGRLVDAYRKRRLVPFGEFVPWRRFLPSLERYGVPTTDMAEGDGDGILHAGRLKIGAGICFESLFPDLARKEAQAGADLLAVATNDSYYARTPAAAFHAASLELRSAETGRYAVQAAATGLSLVASPGGGAFQSGLFQKAAMVVPLPDPSVAPHRETLWVRAWWAAWFILLALAAAGLVPSPKPRSGDASGQAS